MIEVRSGVEQKQIGTDQHGRAAVAEHDGLTGVNSRLLQGFL